MTDALEFDIVCPHNHDQTITLTREAFEDTLKSGGLIFHCNTCETNWSPSGKEIAHFRKEFLKTQD